MNRLFCIHPIDLTTEFLTPVYDKFMEKENIQGVSGDSTDDNFYDVMSDALNDTGIHTYIFLGHGCSNLLYGNGFSELITLNELIKNKDKAMILFACNSIQLLEKAGIRHGLGFGFIPSGPDDILHSTKFHNLDLSQMNVADWSILRQVYQKCWIRSIDNWNEKGDVCSLSRMFHLFLSKSIAEILHDFTIEKRILISNILFHIKKDMKFLGYH